MILEQRKGLSRVFKKIEAQCEKTEYFIIFLSFANFYFTSYAVIKLVPLFQPLVLQPQHQHLGSEINMKENYHILYPKQTKLPMRTFAGPKY